MNLSDLVRMPLPAKIRRVIDRKARLENLIERREAEFTELARAFESRYRTENLYVEGSNAQHIVDNAINVGKAALDLAYLPIPSRDCTRRAIRQLRGLGTYFELLREYDAYEKAEMTGSDIEPGETGTKYRKRIMGFKHMYENYGSKDLDYIKESKRIWRVADRAHAVMEPVSEPSLQPSYAVEVAA